MKQVLVAIIVGLACAAVARAETRAGAAAVVITPPLGVPMAGYYSARGAEGVHDDLHAKAIVIEQDGVKAALVVCDLIGMPQFIAEEARKLIASGTGVKGEMVMISATHTHTGPSLPGRSSREPLEGAPDTAKEYVRKLPSLIAQSVKEAEGRLTDVTAMIGVGYEHRVGFNRRFIMEDGTVGWNPGKLNPKIVRPAGPIDPEVKVLAFNGDGGNTIATYVNFAVHPDTVGGQEISADYAHTLSKILSKVKGESMVTVFANGTCGDINHVDVGTKEPQKGHGEAERIGTVLAGEVIKTYARMKPVAPGSLRAKSEVVKLPLAQIKDGEVEVARRTSLKSDAKFLEKVHAFKVLDVAARGGRPIEAEVQVIALGDDVAWVGLPGEIFVELGLEIKRRSPFRQTIVVELANNSIGYVPTKRAFGEGNYEVVSARCAEGSGEMLVEAALRLLNELRGAPKGE